jgi:hypothetical protein
MQQMFGLMTELIFVLAGGLLFWAAFTSRFPVYARRPAWLVLSVIVILWGGRAWLRARLIAVRKLRLAARLGGASLMLVGAILLSLGWIPLGRVELMLALAGGIFVLRGLVNAAIFALAS